MCLCSQVLAELFAVVTDHRRVSQPRTPAEATAAIEFMLSRPGMILLPTPGGTVTRWLDLARREPVTGGGIFDVQLVATMLENGVRRIYTFNRSDFVRFIELDVVTPA